MAQDVFIAAAVRTPVGRHGGALARVRPDDLAASALRGLLDAVPDLEPESIDDVIMGDVNGAGEDNRNVARMASLLAGLPVSVPGATVNRLCGSGLQAIVDASRAIAAGDASLVIAGGVESMTRAPLVIEAPSRAYPTTNQTVWSTALGWRMVNPAMPSEWTLSMGEGAELLADRYEISREAQDLFALESHRKAAAAWAEGAFKSEVTEVRGVELSIDESIRADTTLEKLGALKPVFRRDGTVTAGNSSPLNDGASALLLADEAGLERSGAVPLARIVSRAAAGVDPRDFGIGPVPASAQALARAGIGWGDLSSVELNEAFAAQSLACLAEWPSLDPALVNPAGGAIALGHALGNSGGRIVTSLAHRLHRQGGGWGLATMCIGVGQGIAMVLEGV
jgi:acetyl-CoA acetyltransferase family protein